MLPKSLLGECFETGFEACLKLVTKHQDSVKNTALWNAFIDRSTVRLVHCFVMRKTHIQCSSNVPSLSNPWIGASPCHIPVDFIWSVKSTGTCQYIKLTILHKGCSVCILLVLWRCWFSNIYPDIKFISNTLSINLRLLYSLAVTHFFLFYQTSYWW